MPLPQEADVNRKVLGGLNHVSQVGRTSGNRGGIGGIHRTGAATDMGGNTVVEGGFYLVGGNEVNVSIYPASGDNHACSADDLSAHADFNVDIVLGVGVTRLPNLINPAVLYTDIGLVNSGVIDNCRAGNHQIDHVVG